MSILPEVKASEALSAGEIDEMHAIYRSIDPNMPDNHIVINHIETTRPVFHLFKVDGRIKAFQAYTLREGLTPFSHKRIPIIYINLSYKSLDAGAEVKNFAKEGNFLFLRQTFGQFWYLRKFVNILQSYNPNLVQRISDSFPISYPHPTEPTPDVVTAFAQKFFKEDLNVHYASLNQNLVKEYLYPQPTRITDKWRTYYESSQPERNTFFLENGIVAYRDNHYFLTGRAVLFIGYYSFSKMIGQKVGLN